MSSTLLINGAMVVMIYIMAEQHNQKWYDFRDELVKTIGLQEDYITELKTVRFIRIQDLSLL